MGSLVVVDTWLLSLANQAPPCARVAAMLGRVQHRIAKNQGHILAISDTGIRQVITRECRKGLVPRMNVRCMRCDALATLDDWLACAAMAEDDRFAFHHRLTHERGEFRAAYLHNCPGDAYGQAVLERLITMSKESV